MKTLRSLLALACLACASIASAQEGWHDMQGHPHPSKEAAKSRNGFAALLIITPDKDWAEKWNTSPETVPSFSTTSNVGDGGELFILTFLSNPTLDTEGMTDVSCDVTVLRPDGSASIDERGQPCFNTRLTTDPRSVYLSGAVVKYVEEPADQRGKWTVEVNVRDNVGGVEIPLRSSFLVK